MTKVKFPPPSIWLSIKACKTAYDGLAKLQLQEDPLPDFDKREPGRLEGILGAVSQEVFGIKANPDLLEAGVSYFIKIIKGHPLPNGNKRSAILFTDVFLYLNGYELKVSHKKMYALAILIAKEKKLSDSELKIGVRKIFSRSIIKRDSSWFSWSWVSFKWWRGWKKSKVINLPKQK